MANQLIHFGKFSLLYEDGFVRYIRGGGLEILRKIYFALRDSSWVTADIVRTDERISVSLNEFDISYVATNKVDDKEVFKWRVRISGNASGEIDFAVDGVALSNYNRNRAGICVLHPIRETKDKPVKITRPDKSVYDDKFPALIKPNQPFIDIRKMSWQLDGDVWAELDFEGDIFETEDQRNWADTSFKTYSTPLSIPYPVMLNPGDKVTQRVKLKILNADRLPTSDLSEDIEVMIHEGDTKLFPKIGTEFPNTQPSQKEIDLMKPLRFQHLRIELVISDPEWQKKLKLGIEEANATDIPVFVHLIVNNPEEWDTFAGRAEIKSIVKLAISPLDRKGDVDVLLRYILPKARKLFPGVEIGAGFRSYFTELNRNRFDYSGVDFLIYSLNPQVHATDTNTIIENIPAQEDAVKTANAFAPGKKIHAGPVTIKPRFNPDAKAGTLNDPGQRFDPRQQTLLAAGWMLASIKYLSEGGVDSITLFESHGLAGYLLEDKLFPVYSALSSLQKLKPKRVVVSSCNAPLVVTSLVVEGEHNRKTLILINHTNVKKFVTVRDTLYTLADFEIQFLDIQ